MPRYYLNLRSRDGPEGLAVDLEGDELAGPEALREHVHGTARDLIRHTRLSSIPDWLTCSFEVTDEAGQPVLTFPFRDAAEAPAHAPDIVFRPEDSTALRSSRAAAGAD